MVLREAILDFDFARSLSSLVEWNGAGTQTLVGVNVAKNNRATPLPLHYSSTRKDRDVAVEIFLFGQQRLSGNTFSPRKRFLLCARLRNTRALIIYVYTATRHAVLCRSRTPQFDEIFLLLVVFFSFRRSEQESSIRCSRMAA